MRVVIVEDYPPVAMQIEGLTREILGDALSSLQRFENVEEFFDHLEQHTVDLVLLDLNLGGDDGFEVLKRAASRSFFCIVISANTHRALEAFEYGVLDFIGKPVDAERLGKAFDRLNDASSEGRSALRYLAVSKHGAIALVDIDDVVFVKGADKYSELHLADGSTTLHDKSLDKLEFLLRPKFCRVHKSYLVDLAQIEEINVHGGGSYEAQLRSGGLIPVGRTRYKQLREKLG